MSLFPLEVPCRCGWPLCTMHLPPRRPAPQGPPDTPHTLRPEGYCPGCRSACRHGSRVSAAVAMGPLVPPHDGTGEVTP